MVLVLVLGFGESTRLASAYGISVVGTMLITTLMLGFLVFKVWRWNRWLASGTIGLFLLVDGTYFASNITKIPDGGWFRSEEHTSELQSLMRISYAVFCLKKKNKRESSQRSHKNVSSRTQKYKQRQLLWS